MTLSTKINWENQSIDVTKGDVLVYTKHQPGIWDINHIETITNYLHSVSAKEAEQILKIIYG